MLAIRRFDSLHLLSLRILENISTFSAVYMKNVSASVA